jgi:hypothetical protein
MEALGERGARIPFKQITQQYLDKFDGRDMGRPRRPATVNRMRAALSSLFRFAMDEGLIRRNPVQVDRIPIIRAMQNVGFPSIGGPPIIGAFCQRISGPPICSISHPRAGSKKGVRSRGLIKDLIHINIKITIKYLLFISLIIYHD